jgi:integrase/recombinase XerD
VLRHSTAMHLFQAGVDMAAIALWLGHESIETTHICIEADLATKERSIEQVALTSNRRRIAFQEPIEACYPKWG